MMRIHGIALTLCLLFGIIVGNVDNNAFEEFKNNFRALQGRVDAQNVIIRQLVANYRIEKVREFEVPLYKYFLIKCPRNLTSFQFNITIRSVDGIGWLRVTDK